MKKLILSLLVLSLVFVQCQKEPVNQKHPVISGNEKTLPSHCTTRMCALFKASLNNNDYEEVGFYSGLFNQWSYTNSGPIISIETDSILGAGWDTDWYVTAPGEIYVGSPFNDQALIYAGTGDTLIVDFVNLSDIQKWIPYP